jgi:hypothetical protein
MFARRLTCFLVLVVGATLATGIVAVPSFAFAQSRLPQCPQNPIPWANCQGTLTGPDGSKYVGAFKDDKFHGQGTFTTSDGIIYVGEWKDGKQNGQGTVTLPDGEKYVGAFKDNKFHGKGTLTNANGFKYVGTFKDNNFNGQGTLTSPDGSKFVGAFKDDKFEGRGTSYSADGSVKQSGIWKDSKFVGRLRKKAIRLVLRQHQCRWRQKGAFMLACPHKQHHQLEFHR